MDNPLLRPDPGLFIWTIITFLVLLAVLAKFAWGPLLKALDARQQSIRAALDDAQRAKQEREPIRCRTTTRGNAAESPVRSRRHRPQRRAADSAGNSTRPPADSQRGGRPVRPDCLEDPSTQRFA